MVSAEMSSPAPATLLTLRGATLILTTANTFYYETADCKVLLGPDTIVTADDNPLLTNLRASSVAVGDRIVARGLYQATGAPAATGACGDAYFGEPVELNSTGTSATNTGSVRLQQSEAFGTLVSAAPGNVVMDLASIDYWPAAVYDFTGNGTPTPVPTAFSVNTEGLTLPAGTVPGDLVYANGYASALGQAPPDYLAFALNNELSVQTAGGLVGRRCADDSRQRHLRRRQPGLQPRGPVGELARGHDDALHELHRRILHHRSRQRRDHLRDHPDRSGILHAGLAPVESRSSCRRRMPRRRRSHPDIRGAIR